MCACEQQQFRFVGHRGASLPVHFSKQAAFSYLHVCVWALVNLLYGKFG